MKKFTLAMTTVIMAALAVSAAGAADPTIRGIDHVTMSGAVKCSNLSGVGSGSAKFTVPVNGASASGINIFVNGNTVDWYVVNNAPAVRAVIVKGGKDTNVYRYPYPAEHFSDGGLHPPTNPKNGSVYSLGYVEFCYSAS